MILHQIHLMPVDFDPYDLTAELKQSSLDGRPPSYRPPLGNIEWFLYQYQIEGIIDRKKIETDLEYRDSILPVGKMKMVGRKDVYHSRIVNGEVLYEFITLNYLGWAPYASGMLHDEVRPFISQLYTRLVRRQRRADVIADVIIIEYSRGIFPGSGNHLHDMRNPFLVTGVYCVIDTKEKIFSELIMGGSD